MAPVRNTMSFIDYEETDSRGNWQKAIRYEAFVTQAFWGDEQYVHIVLKKSIPDARPIIQI